MEEALNFADKISGSQEVCHRNYIGEINIFFNIQHQMQNLDGYLIKTDIQFQYVALPRED